MATYSQTPGLLNIKAVTGTDFSCQLDFNTNLSGYTFDAAIVLQEYPTKIEQAITVFVDNASQGIITLSLTDAQTSLLGTFSKKKWYLNWNVSGIKQTILAGIFELSDIPLGQNIVTSTGVTINTHIVDITLSAFSNAALDGKQPLNSALTQISGLSPNNDDFLQRKSGAWTNRSIAQVKTDLAISNIDNTSDLNKPISNATSNALSYKVNTNQISAFGYTLIDDSDASSARSTLGLGSAAIESSSSFQPIDSDLTSISGLAPTNDDFLQRKSGAWTNRSVQQVKTDLAINNVDNTSDANKPLSDAAISSLSYKVNTSQISAFGYTLIDDSDSATARTTLGLGTAATADSSSFQASDSDLTAIAVLTPSDNDFLQRKSGAWTNRSLTQVSQDLGVGNKLDSTLVSAFGLDLIDSTNSSDARTTLGLGTVSTQNANNVAITGGTISGITDLSLADGGTNNSLTASSGGIVYSTISQLAISGVGETGQYLMSNGANAPSWETPSTNAFSVSINNENFSDQEYYPVFAYQSANSPSSLYGSSAKLKYNPSNGYLTADGINATNPISLSSGGTNSSLTASSGSIVYSDSSSIKIGPSGTSGQVLVSGGTGAPSWSSLTNLQIGTSAATIVNNDNSTNREYFPVFAYQSTGSGSLLYGSTNKLKFNPSNGYFNAEGGFIADSGDLQLKDGGIHWAGGIVFNAENQEILPNDSGVPVAVWNSTNGMGITGTASKDVPLRLMNSLAGNLSAGAYIIVRPSASATTNGTELRNAYAEAKAFTPNSLPLSATNRATVLLLPGRYDLGTTPLAMDTEFVDLVGISEESRHVFITSQVVLSDSGTIVQTVDNVVIRNVSIDRTGAPSGSGAGRTAAYFPSRASTAISSWASNGTTATVASNGHGLQDGDSVRISGSGNSSFDGVYTITRIDDNSFTFPSTVNSSGSIGTATERFDDTYIENCRFSGTSDSGMRRTVEYAGTYRRCNGGAGSFGTEGSFASGLFEDCVATSGSFGGRISVNGSIASGIFRRCVATSLSFGIDNSSGLFEDCTATTESFGSRLGSISNATGTFRRCTGISDCFGFVTASGTFENCSVTNGYGFGARSGSTASGIFIECSMTNSESYAGTFTGTMRRCQFVTTGTNNNALRLGNGAKVFDSTLIATGTGNSITAGSSVTISLAGCRMNREINANVSNNLGTLTESYNLIDADIT